MRNLGLSVPSLALQLLSSAAVPGFFWNADENPLSLLMTGITHSRSSLAYMVDASGKYTTCPNNLVAQSNNFTSVSWAKVSATVTAGAADPLGGTSACTMTATANNGQVYQGASNAAAGSTRYNTSWWIRRRTGTGAVKIYSPDGVASTTVAVDGTWQQFSLNGLGNGGGIAYATVVLAVSGDAVDIYCATLSQVTYETTLRPDDQVVTGAALFYGLRCSYDTSTITYDGNNILTYSNDFANATWQKVASGTGTVPALTPGSGPGPDGTPNAATTVVFNTGAGTSASDQSNIILNGGVTTPSRIKYLGGIWIKGSAGGKIQIRHQAAGPYTLWTLTGGWDRVFSVEDGLVTSAQFSVGLRQGVPSTINSSLTVQIAYATVSAVTTETAPRPQDQVITTSAPYYFMGGGLTFAPPTKRDLLIEDARTNYLGYSESPGTWSNGNLTYAYAANSKLGTLGVTTLTQTLSNTATSTFFANSPASVNGDVWTFTAEIMGVGSKTMCYPALYGSVSVWGVNGDCTAKILSGPGSLSQTVGGLWQITGLSTSVPTVVSVTRTIRQSENIQAALYLQTGPAGTAGDQIKVACPQLEKGPYASSYTPTWSSATSVARGADAVDATGPLLAALQSSSASVVMEVAMAGYTSVGRILGLSDYQTPVCMGVQTSAVFYNGASNLYATIGGSGAWDTGRVRVAAAWSAAGRSLVANGGTLATDAGAMQIPVTAATVGQLVGGGNTAPGKYKSIAVWKSRLPDATLTARSVLGASIFA